MEKLFKKIDSSWSTAKIIVNVSLILAAILVAILSVILLAKNAILVGLIVLLAGLFIIFISFIFWNLLFGFLADVKLIRNKLYGERSSGIAMGYGVSISDIKEKVDNQN